MTQPNFDKTIPPYNPDAACPKCGRTPVGTRSCEYTTPGFDVWHLERHNPLWVNVIGGHLHRTCGRCDYEWIELAINARMQTEEEAALMYEYHKAVWKRIDDERKARVSA